MPRTVIQSRSAINGMCLFLAFFFLSPASALAEKTSAAFTSMSEKAREHNDLLT